MVYDVQHHRLVLLGTLYGDNFATSLNIAPSGGSAMDHVSDTLLAAIATVVGDWFDNGVGLASPLITSNAKLTSIKLNSIDVNGHYEQPFTMEHIYATPIAGAGTTGNQAAQIATVVTLRTSVERGKASKGRMYLPLLAGYSNMGLDGRAVHADALRAANSVMSLINSINSIYTNPPGVATPGRVAVMSNVGSGIHRNVTHTSAGRVPDTMRSRRNKLVEEPVMSTI